MANLSNINNILRVSSSGVGINKNNTGPSELDIESAGADMIDMTRTGQKTYRFAISGASAFSLFDVAANADRLVIDSSGNSTFAGQVEVALASNQIKLSTGTAGDGYLNIGHFSNGTFIGTYGDDGGVADVIRFGTHSGDERMRIDSSGNVGIGTATLNTISGTNPTLTLGGTGISGGLILQRAGTDKARLYENAGNMVHQGMTGVGHHFYVNAATQAMVIDSSGNVGIGTDSPEYKVHQQGTGLQRNLIECTDNNAGGAGVFFRVMNGASQVSNGTVTIDNSGNMKFFTGTSSESERMRIDSSGNVLVQATASGGNGLSIRPNATAGTVQQIFNRASTTSDSYVFDFQNGGTTVGFIRYDNTSTAYSTSSDYRLKENVVEMTGALDRVSQLKPSRFNFISDADKTVDGFLAHEVQEIVPEAITGEKDGMRTEEYEVSPAVYEDVFHPAEEAVYETVEHPAVEEELDDEGNIIVEAVEAYTEEVLVTEAKEEWTEKVLVTEKVMGTREVPDYQGIDQSKLVPLLVGAIQELKAEIESLKQQINN